VTKKELIDLRLARKEDLNFIFSTWLKGIKGGNDLYRMADPRSFTLHYGEFMKRKIARTGVLVMVACLKEDNDVILGYSITERIKDYNVLHWIYVKKEWRRIGIAKDLLPARIDICTTMTKLGKQLKPKSVVFDPFL
jgi:GNAT superfamily N-acetyltransferase